MKSIYMDHAATTPMHPDVLEAMRPWFIEKFGNPSSLHAFGQEARRAMARAREQVAALVGAQPDEIIFTSGGSEADNMALQGVAVASESKGRHIITSAVEHHAVLDTAAFLKRRGWDVTVLPVDAQGFVNPDDVRKALREDTVLISIMHANNEIGVIEPIEEIGRIAAGRRVAFHTDAVQTVGAIDVDVNRLGVDLLSMSAHKLYGPKGIGALYVRKGTRISPLIHGGGQERKRRSGTEDIPSIVGFGAAAEIARREIPDRIAHLTPLRDTLLQEIPDLISDVIVNGPRGDKRLPNNVNICVRYVEGEAMLLRLDHVGIAASSGSACTSGSLDPSHVLMAIGLPHEVAHGSLRFSLGRANTPGDVAYVLDKLPGIVELLRAMSPVTPAK